MNHVSEKSRAEMAGAGKQDRSKMKWIDDPGIQVPYYTFDHIDQSGFAVGGFTTRFYRKNGEPDDFFQPLLRPDSDPAAVAACVRLLTGQFGIDPQHRVKGAQQHTANVYKVTEKDLGPEETRPKYSEIDGLITNLPGVMLQTFGADCPCVYLLDPVSRAIGLCHSGRKGTQLHIAGHMLQKMHQEYGTKPCHVRAAISPGICMDCYEVGDEVAEDFLRDYYQWEGLKTAGTDRESLIAKRIDGRYHLNLNDSIAETLECMGVLSENIEKPGLCTRCRSDIFYSFRAQGCITNENCAFLMIKKETANGVS